ncbi:MAG: TauD/TfdA family dioxygenase [Nostoc indistinguendum CM1-VF10]|jgi:alpha-ketoglutarate-dependent taurine dioxygenase|nr:TauD/TfdA family dioxygenase [Nostoc indistinguendum CM1-VF10]
MKNLEINKSSLKLGTYNRKAVNISQEGLIKTEYLEPETPLPLVVQPSVEGLNLVAWATRNRHFIETHLLKHGAILFRKFNAKSIAEFEQFIKVISGELLEYSYRSTPRSQVFGNIYTSTEYPAAQSIPLHNEMSYSRNWPMKIWFFCIKVAQQGGETPIADSRKVLQRITPKLIEQFMRKKVMYIRNYGDELDLPWQNVFQTENKAEVEDYCHKAGIDFEWKGRNHLRTRQVCQAVATHHKTDEMVWFNQAHLFHVSSLQPAVRELLLAELKEEELPRNTYYGDGSPIETSVLDEIREAYQQEAVMFPWQEGDILMLDNMLTAHGRAPFLGSRKVVVGMAEPFNNQDT